MSNASGSAQKGWPLLEAIQRTTDPKSWEAWIAAKQALDKVRERISSGPSTYLEPAPRVVASHRKAAKFAFEQLKNELWDHLINERLIGLTSRGSATEPPTLIDSAGWSGLF